jgi:hypothetical protein
MNFHLFNFQINCITAELINAIRDSNNYQQDLDSLCQRFYELLTTKQGCDLIWKTVSKDIQ